VLYFISHKKLSCNKPGLEWTQTWKSYTALIKKIICSSS